MYQEYFIHFSDDVSFQMHMRTLVSSVNNTMQQLHAVTSSATIVSHYV